MDDNLRQFLTRQNLLPPLTLIELDKLATAFLAQHPGGDRERLVIEINNHLWREVMLSIPLDRRLLLLPQCLRRQPGCQADFDELGLLCNDCGSDCQIAQLQRAADRLGVNTMVAEGSGAVSAIIADRDIAGLIGVGCIDSLKKAFPRILERGLPAQAIILDGCDCVNTKVDEEAVLAALAYRPGKFFDLRQIRIGVEALFTSERLEQFLGPTRSGSDRIVREYLCANGKRHRPVMAAAGFAAAAGCPECLPEPVLRAALSIEFFHKASLIHDDIEDGDDFRDHIETLHKKYNLALALNAGDLLIGDGYRVLSKIADPAMKALLWETAAECHCDLCVGQGMEFEHLAPEPARILEMYALKTGKAFLAALSFGLICAGKFLEYREMLQAFSRLLGIAYQIRDDLDDRAATGANLLAVLGETAAREHLARCRDELYGLLSAVPDADLKLFLFQLTGRVLDDGN